MTTAGRGRRSSTATSAARASSSGRISFSSDVPSPPIRHGRTPGILLAAWGAAIALLHCYGALNPTSRNWGFHELAFFPDAVKFGIPLLMLLVLLPAVQEALLLAVRRAAARWNDLPRGGRRAAILLFVAASALLFWLCRERIFLLGDGALILRMVKNI